MKKRTSGRRSTKPQLKDTSKQAHALISFVYSGVLCVVDG